jgi:hypothetical protein
MTRTSLWLFFLAVTVATAVAQVTPVSILDTQVRSESGALWNGVITIQSRATMPAGVTLVPTGITLHVVGGHLSAVLYPGTYAVFYVNTQKTATWTIPTGGPFAIRDIESGIVTTPIYPIAYSLIAGLSQGSMLYGGATGIAQLLPAPGVGTYGVTFTNSVPAWSSSEPALGNPSVTGSFLVSTSAGVRSWVFVRIPQAATAAPKMDGTVAVGTASKYALEDHVHPVDTSRQAAISGAPSRWPSFTQNTTPTCAARGDTWFDNTTTTDVYYVCMMVSGTLVWVVK